MSNAYRAPETDCSAIEEREKYPILMAVSFVLAFALLAYFFEDINFNEDTTLKVRLIIYASFFIPLILIHQTLSLSLSLLGKIVFRHEFLKCFNIYQKIGYTIVTLGILGYLFFGFGRRFLLF